MERRDRAEDIARAPIERVEIGNAEERVDAREACAFARQRREIDDAAVLVEVPGRGRRIEVVRREASEVHEEERPAELAEAIVVAAVEEEREAKRH